MRKTKKYASTLNNHTVPLDCLNYVFETPFTVNKPFRSIYGGNRIALQNLGKAFCISRHFTQTKYYPPIVTTIHSSKRQKRSWAMFTCLISSQSWTLLALCMYHAQLTSGNLDFLNSLLTFLSTLTRDLTQSLPLTFPLTTAWLCNSYKFSSQIPQVQHLSGYKLFINLLWGLEMEIRMLRYSNKSRIEVRWY